MFAECITSVRLCRRDLAGITGGVWRVEGKQTGAAVSPRRVDILLFDKLPFAPFVCQGLIEPVPVPVPVSLVPWQV